MAKSLSARIAQRKVQGARNGKNRAAFLAVRDQVRRALDDGWSIFSIWETLHDEGKVAFSYESFRRFVNRFLVGQRSKTSWGRIAVKTAKETNSSKPDQVAACQDDQQVTRGVRGFRFNPVPNKEDLI
jgi:Family of unknown function (DUF5338)